MHTQKTNDNNPDAQNEANNNQLMIEYLTASGNVTKQNLANPYVFAAQSKPRLAKRYDRNHEGAAG